MDPYNEYESRKQDNFGLVWVDTKTRCSSAIHAGNETNGLEIYVARSLIAGHLKAGKYVDRAGYGMHVAHDGGEHKQATFQLLTNPRDVNVKWTTGNGRNIPWNAVIGGVMGGKPLFIGRCKDGGNTVVGHISPDNGYLWYSWMGKECTTLDYEILVVN